MLTSQIKEVVVLQAVDRLELAAHVVLLSRVEQVPDGRVLVISAKDLLGLEGSFSFVSFRCCVLMRASITQELGSLAFAWKGRLGSLVWLVDVLDREDGQVVVVAEIAQRHAAAGLENQFVDVLEGEVECDGDAEEGAACEAVLPDDSVGWVC